MIVSLIVAPGFHAGRFPFRPSAIWSAVAKRSSVDTALAVRAKRLLNLSLICFSETFDTATVKYSWTAKAASARRRTPNGPFVKALF